MSLMRFWGVRSALASFGEMVFFFGILTPAYFFGISFLVLVLTQGSKGIDADPLAWAGSLPVWLILLLGFGYLLLVVFYWAPGQTRDNESELRGFALFLLGLAIAAAIFLEKRYEAISGYAFPLVTGNLRLILAAAGIVVCLVTGALALRKGYNYLLWVLAGGIIGLIVLAFLPSASKADQPEEEQSQLKFIGNIIGGVMTGLSVFTAAMVLPRL